MMRARRLLVVGVSPATWLAMLVAAPVALAAQPQDDPPAPDGEDEPVRIDILAPAPGALPPSEAEIRECEEEIDAATVTGEIIVCRQIGEDPAYYYSGDRENAQRRYAEETAFAGEIRAPDVAGAGIFRGPATISGLCFIPPCPKDPALLIDVEALPEAEPGSDADRIARGLPPLGQELTPEEIAERRRELGLDGALADPEPQAGSGSD